MMPKYREKLDDAQRRMDETKEKMEAEKQSGINAVDEVRDLMTWAAAFDTASNEVRHMILARLIKRIEISRDYEINIIFRISIEQYTKLAA